MTCQARQSDCPEGTACQWECGPGGCDDDLLHGECIEHVVACDPPEEFVSVSPQALVADPQAYAGASVAVTSVATLDTPACTMRTCPEDEPCCNSCGASLHFSAGGDRAIYLEAPGLSCGGSQCSWSLRCAPLDGALLTVWGEVVVTHDGTPLVVARGLCAPDDASVSEQR